MKGLHYEQNQSPFYARNFEIGTPLLTNKALIVYLLAVLDPIYM